MTLCPSPFALSRFRKDHSHDLRLLQRSKRGMGGVADSGEGYKNEQDYLADIDRVKGSNEAPVKKE